MTTSHHSIYYTHKCHFLTTVSVSFALIFGIFISTTDAIAQTDSESINRWCPVNPTKKASPDFQTKHRDETVCFCCNQCKDAYVQKPELYQHNFQGGSHRGTFSEVNQGPNLELATPPQSTLQAASHFVQQHHKFLLMIALSLSVFLLADLIKRRRAERLFASQLQEYATILFFSKPISLLILMQLSVIAHLSFFTDEFPLSSNSVIHTFDDSSEHAWRILSRQSDIYRDLLLKPYFSVSDQLASSSEVFPMNSDPSPSETPKVSFGSISVAICDESGQRIFADSKIKSHELFINWEIDSKNQNRFDFDNELSNQVLLLHLNYPRSKDSLSSQISERLYTRPQQPKSWKGRFYLGEPETSNEDQKVFDGILYFVKENVELRGLSCIDSALFAVPYRIVVKNGKVTASSKLWIALCNPETRPFTFARIK